MNSTAPSRRQEQVEQFLEDALRDPAIQEALEIYQIGQHEYAQALASRMSVTIFTTNTSTPEDENHAWLDRN